MSEIQSNKPVGAKSDARRRTRRWLPYLGAVVIVAAIVIGLWPQPVPVETAKATVGTLRATVNEEGKTRIKQRYTISAPVAGQLRRIPFKAGAEVRAGETVVAVIDPLNPAPLDARARSLAEAKRDLIDPAELRQLVRHKQAVAIIDTAPPIKFSYPPLVQAATDALSHADYKGVPRVIGFRRAETQENSLERMSPLEPQGSQGSVGEPTIIKERQRTRQRKAEPARRKQATDNLPFDPRS
jgi:multidrug efflux pump subunit AcrA (membrane-fusion protein)